MTHRTDRVYLAPSEPRCDPSRDCGSKAKCARYLAEIPPMGTLTDYSRSMTPFAPWCAHFAAPGRREAGERPEVKPWPGVGNA